MPRGPSWSSITSSALLGLGVAALSAPAVAQEGEFQKVEMRVVDGRPGSATLDRGGVDGLRRGDRVALRLKDGSVVHGALIRIEERASIAELDDPSLVPPAGTRAEVLVPSSRLAPTPSAPPVPTPTPEPEPTEPAVPEHPPWPKREDDWREGQALLARVRPLRPSERPSDVRGRVYSILDWTHSSEDDRTDGFYRVGGEATLENLRGNGERIRFEGELNHRHTDVPDDDDERTTHARIDRASYASGGNRFAPDRLEVGRFLQDNVPEFGLVDGAEWDRRLASGDRFGLSAGFLPEPDPGRSTGQDFQVAGSYRWVYDASEQVSAAAGFQKTLHHADADRDLFLAQFRYLPLDGWTFTSTAWVDYYTAGDANKGSGVELTQAYVNTGKRWANGSSFHAVYTHFAFPELDRDEFLPVTAQQLADDHVDRLALQMRARVSTPMRVHATLGGWVDQDDAGSDGEGGVEYTNFLFERVQLDISGFATQGKFVDLLGARLTLARSLDSGRLSAEFELANSRIAGFNGNNNDLPHSRLRLSAERWLDSGWSLAGHLDGMLWDDESSVILGFFLQKSF